MIRRVLLSVAFLAPLLSVPSPASALASPSLEVTVGPITGGFRACARGSAQPKLVAVLHWEFTVAGTRASTSNPLIAPPSVARDGSVFDLTCINVSKLGEPDGAFTATLTLTSDGLDLSNAVVGTGVWSPSTGDRTSGMSACGGACFSLTPSS